MNCVEVCQISLEQALTMATVTPAELLKLDDQMGSVKEGFRADLIAMSLSDYSCQVVSNSKEFEKATRELSEFNLHFGEASSIAASENHQ